VKGLLGVRKKAEQEQMGGATDELIEKKILPGRLRNTTLGKAASSGNRNHQGGKKKDSSPEMSHTKVNDREKKTNTQRTLSYKKRNTSDGGRGKGLRRVVPQEVSKKEKFCNERRMLGAGAESDYGRGRKGRSSPYLSNKRREKLDREEERTGAKVGHTVRPSQSMRKI